ncbi:MAG: hypothetical protein UDM07_08820, partial [Adlercreutzia sp.]|nr:hypothetical protein [Adlercreutzia sp.]
RAAPWRPRRFRGRFFVGAVADLLGLSWPVRRRCASTAGVESGLNASRNGASSTGGKGEITVE